MASFCRLTGKTVSSSSSSSSSFWVHQFSDKKAKKRSAADKKLRTNVVSCSSSSWSVMDDPYKTLRIQPGASESEVRKAFRQLALQYHPDVCRGNNCGTQFHLINEAYDIVMSNLRGESDDSPLQVQEKESSYYDQGIDEPCRGMYDPDWDLWEEWMGWEGAGIRDYSSHINPYI